MTCSLDYVLPTMYIFLHCLLYVLTNIDDFTHPHPLHIINLLFLLPILYRVFTAVLFAAWQTGQASSTAAGFGKAKASASRILALLKLEPSIDTESPNGLKPVGIIQIMLLLGSFEEPGLLESLNRCTQ